MKRLVLILTSLIGLFFLVNSYAAANFNIGIIDVQKVMQNSPQAKAATKTLQKKFAAQQTKIMDKQNKLKQMIAKLNRDGSIMRDSDKQQLKDKITAARKEFTTLTQNYEQQAMQAQQQLMQKTAEQVNNIAEKIAKQKGLSMVIVSQAVVYPGNAQDITSQVISKMK